MRRQETSRQRPGFGRKVFLISVVAVAVVVWAVLSIVHIRNMPSEDREDLLTRAADVRSAASSPPEERNILDHFFWTSTPSVRSEVCGCKSAIYSYLNVSNFVLLPSPNNVRFSSSGSTLGDVVDRIDQCCGTYTPPSSSCASCMNSTAVQALINTALSSLQTCTNCASQSSVVSNITLLDSTLRALVAADVAQLSQNVSAVNSTLRQVNSTLWTAISAIGSLSSGVNATQIAQLSLEISSLQLSVQSVEADIMTIDTDIQALQVDVASLRTLNFSSQISALQASVAGIVSTITNINADIADLTASLSTCCGATGNVTVINNTFSVDNATLTALIDSELSSFGAQIATDAELFIQNYTASYLSSLNLTNIGGGGSVDNTTLVALINSTITADNLATKKYAEDYARNFTIAYIANTTAAAGINASTVINASANSVTLGSFSSFKVCSGPVCTWPYSSVSGGLEVFGSLTVRGANSTGAQSVVGALTMTRACATTSNCTWASASLSTPLNVVGGLSIDGVDIRTIFSNVTLSGTIQGDVNATGTVNVDQVVANSAEFSFINVSSWVDVANTLNTSVLYAGDAFIGNLTVGNETIFLETATFHGPAFFDYTATFATAIISSLESGPIDAIRISTSGSLTTPQFVSVTLCDLNNTNDCVHQTNFSSEVTVNNHLHTQDIQAVGEVNVTGPFNVDGTTTLQGQLFVNNTNIIDAINARNIIHCVDMFVCDNFTGPMFQDNTTLFVPSDFGVLGSNGVTAERFSGSVELRLINSSAETLHNTEIAASSNNNAPEYLSDLFLLESSGVMMRKTGALYIDVPVTMDLSPYNVSVCHPPAVASRQICSVNFTPLMAPSFYNGCDAYVNMTIMVAFSGVGGEVGEYPVVLMDPTSKSICNYAPGYELVALCAMNANHEAQCDLYEQDLFAGYRDYLNVTTAVSPSFHDECVIQTEQGISYFYPTTFAFDNNGFIVYDTDSTNFLSNSSLPLSNLPDGVTLSAVCYFPHPGITTVGTPWDYICNYTVHNVTICDYQTRTNVPIKKFNRASSFGIFTNTSDGTMMAVANGVYEATFSLYYTSTSSSDTAKGALYTNGFQVGGNWIGPNGYRRSNQQITRVGYGPDPSRYGPVGSQARQVLFLGAGDRVEFGITPDNSPFNITIHHAELFLVQL